MPAVSNLVFLLDHETSAVRNEHVLSVAELLSSVRHHTCLRVFEIWKFEVRIVPGGRKVQKVCRHTAMGESIRDEPDLHNHTAWSEDWAENLEMDVGNEKFQLKKMSRMFGLLFRLSGYHAN